MDDDEEDNIVFGTPLPEIEDETVLRKKAAKELQVRDEKGRQRFHGAFTGGFSAGYFNTVGTKKGWAPSAFISSRSKISDRIQQNPEDFMDDEDFGEFGIATRKIHTTSNFQDTSDANARKRKYVDTDTVIPGEAPLKDIVQPVRESIGIVILKKLGWRQGQGIGPRVKKHNSDVKMYGCSPFPDTVILEEDDPMFAAFTFAPEDTEGMSYQPKDNYFGLGYSGLSKQSILHASVDPFAPTSTKSWLAKDKRKLAISGQAFGVGAFEDDDEDIYGKEDMSQYDFNDLTLAGSEDPHKTIKSSKHSNFQGILEGFCIASQSFSAKNHYPPPELPRNFKPIHLKSVSSVLQNTKRSKSSHALSASDRSFLLGERKFQKASSNAPDAAVGKNFCNFENVQNITSTSSTSLNFQPFSTDSSKQQRYEEYLKLKEIGDIGNLKQPSSMTEWEKQQEKEEFAKSAVLFKPLSNVLCSRFESSSCLSIEQEVMFALEKFKKKEEKVIIKKNLIGTSNRTTMEWHPVPLLCKRMNVPNPYPNSSSSGTHNVSKSKSVFDHVFITDEKFKTSEKAAFSVPIASTSIENKVQQASKTPEDVLPYSKQVPNVATSDKNTDDFPLEDKRPPMDFFKDIFDKSSSDEDTTADEKMGTSNKLLSSEKEICDLTITEGSIQKDINSSQKSINTETKQLSQTFPSSLNSQKSSTGNKVSFGVFENLDFDALNQRKLTEKSTHQNVSKSENDTIKIHLIPEVVNVHDENVLKNNDQYGPELPPNFSNSPLPASSSFKIPSKKHSKHKSKHKHHKHKGKKKKKSSRDSSGSDSSDELDDIPPSLIIEKIKKLQKRKC